MSRAYKIYYLGSATANGAASLRVVKNGRIRAIMFTWFGVGGAGVDCRWTDELSKQNTGSQLINDAPDTVLATASGQQTVASSGIGQNCLIAGLNCPVTVGDTLYLNTLLTGTAPTALNHVITIYVE